MKRKYFGKTRKIRSISIDSDVIIDILAYEILKNVKTMSKEERNYFRRCKISLELLALISSVRIETLGTAVIKKELSLDSRLRELYEKVFDQTIPLSFEVKNLAKSYLRKRHIKKADAFILACVTYGKVDCLVSWNREHIVNKETHKVLSETNKKRNFPSPLVITPEEFLESIILSPNRSICFSQKPIPYRYRPRSFLSKLDL